jgi:hypothetical protein
MSTALLRFCLILLLVAIPIAEVLSHMICPVDSSCRIRSDAACCPAANKAAYSASPALATKHGIIIENTWMDPLILMGSCFLPWKNIAKRRIVSVIDKGKKRLRKHAVPCRKRDRLERCGDG